MADNDSASAIQRDTKEALEKQVAQMQSEINSLKKTLAAKAEEVSGWIGDFSEQANRAGSAIRSKAHSVSDVVQDNPVTFSTTAVLFGAIGFLIGLVVGQNSDHRKHHWH